ncbi:MAG: polyprenyl synthetase family protein [Sedimentibacter sp.]|uniref:polyprenyl synthetase family protein n=1 Tax=Sedimentibacter sp. TaxID=1960295 RepID=UPI0029821E0A|nr:farnesyl diphosphate synthase [Sedimentibacter sp.]MDW5298535.1 polyprenyl synthetase family protein [Sedimentibacter sp.]
MEFKNWMDEKVSKIDENLSTIISEEENPQKVIYESMNYSLLSGGKRLRPVLLLGTYEIFQENIEDVIPFACSMEMIHTYSLIHDDLPAMDNDDYRRGRLSNHKKFGEATGILAGDGLLNKAFETGLEAALESKLDINKSVKALCAIAKSSGADGMIGGQIVDMYGHEKISSIDDLKYMYSLKTGAIIKSSVVAGAILGGANDAEIAALELYAEKLGIGFQIEDDILDVTSTQEVLGKAIGSDAANDKITYLSFVNIDEAKEHVEKFTQEAIESLSIFGDKAKYMIELARYLTNRDH